MVVTLEYRMAIMDLRSPLATAHGPIRQRTTWLVRAAEPGGRTSAAGYGEAAPLPGFGGGDPGRVVEALETLSHTLDRTNWIGLGERSGDEHGRLADSADLGRLERAWEAALPDDGAARAGVSFALADLAARRAGLPLAAWLATQAGDTAADMHASGGRALASAPAQTVPVNGLIGASLPEEAGSEARRLVASGYSTLKVKVGGDPDADVARVRAVRAAAGAGVGLRLDANEGWTEDMALRALERLAVFDIEYVEQPVARGEIEAMARLRRRSVVAIAADEALLERGGPEALAAAEAADVWVLKPALLGGPFRTLELARRGAALGVRSVVTTAMDGGVGRQCALHTAAVIAGYGWDGGLAHGLGTGGLLQNDVVATPEPVGGRMQVAAVPGLGCTDPVGPWIVLGAHGAS